MYLCRMTTLQSQPDSHEPRANFWMIVDWLAVSDPKRKELQNEHSLNNKNLHGKFVEKW